jgi:hypothetical protein
MKVPKRGKQQQQQTQQGAPFNGRGNSDFIAAVCRRWSSLRRCPANLQQRRFVTGRLLLQQQGAASANAQSEPSRPESFILGVTDLVTIIFKALFLRLLTRYYGMQLLVRGSSSGAGTKIRWWNCLGPCCRHPGDSLLCKLVTIGAFSECYLIEVPKEGERTTAAGMEILVVVRAAAVLHTTTAVACTANLILVTIWLIVSCRILEKMTTSTSQKAVPSVRLFASFVTIRGYR